MLLRIIYMQYWATITNNDWYSYSNSGYPKEQKIFRDRLFYKQYKRLKGAVAVYFLRWGCALMLYFMLHIRLYEREKEKERERESTLFPIVISYKLTADILLANTVTILLRDIGWTSCKTPTTHFRQPIYTQSYFVYGCIETWLNM